MMVEEVTFMKKANLFLVAMLLYVAAAPVYAESQTHIKQQSVFYSNDLLAKVHRNVAGNSWAASIKQQIIKAVTVTRIVL